jgi:hypothetical protein
MLIPRKNDERRAAIRARHDDLIGLADACDRTVDRFFVAIEPGHVAAALAATHRGRVPGFQFHDEFALRTRAGDACVRHAKALGVKRFVAALGLVSCLAMAGCKDPSQTNTPTANGQSVNTLVRPASDVVIKSVKEYSANSAIAGNNGYEYYVVKFTYTNDLGYAFTPLIHHFVLEDVDNRKFQGQDSGDTALVGITNYFDVLKPGDSHDYTVGFLVPQNTYGTLLYDPTEA